MLDGVASPSLSTGRGESAPGRIAIIGRGAGERASPGLVIAFAPLEPSIRLRQSTRSLRRWSYSSRPRERRLTAAEDTAHCGSEPDLYFVPSYRNNDTAFLRRRSHPDPRSPARSIV